MPIEMAMSPCYPTWPRQAAEQRLLGQLAEHEEAKRAAQASRARALHTRQVRGTVEAGSATITVRKAKR